MATLPVRAIPGVGSRLESQLTQFGVRVVADLRAHRKIDLVRAFGERSGNDHSTHGELEPVIGHPEANMNLERMSCLILE